MDPHATELELVTIVAESLLEDEIAALVMRCGARGWTSTDARGAGNRGKRSAGQVEGNNVRIETLVSAGVAGAILDELARDYFPHYAVVAWVQRVGVVRGSKYA